MNNCLSPNSLFVIVICVIYVMCAFLEISFLINAAREHLIQDRSSNKNDNCENSVVKRSQPYPASNLGPDTLKRRKTCFPGRVGSNNHTRDERTSSLETTEMQNR